MADRTPTQQWDYLEVGTLVPAQKDQLYGPCALCRCQALLDNRGALFTGPENCQVVCDQCGEREAPEALALVRRLRTCVEFTVTVGGARPHLDVEATACPVCRRDHDGAFRRGWHIVDATHGRSVCPACVATLDPALRSLTEALEAHGRHNDMFEQDNLSTYLTH
jgi:hypothetical protein